MKAEYKADRFSFFQLVSGLVLLALLFCGGCRFARQEEPLIAAPVAPEVLQPPATFVDAFGRFVPNRVAATASERWLLFSWFVEMFPDDRNVAAFRKYRDAASRELVVAWRAELGESVLVETVEGRLVLAAAEIPRESRKEGFAESVDALAARLLKGPRAESTEEKCLREILWSGSLFDRRNDFRTWLKTKDRGIKGATDGDVALLIEEVRGIREALSLRDRIEELLKYVELLADSRRFEQGLAELAKGKLNGEQKKSLRMIGAARLVDKLQEQNDFLSRVTVSTACDFLEENRPAASAEMVALDSYEEQFAERLSKWREDARFAQALKIYEGRLRELALVAARLRGNFWEREVRMLTTAPVAWNRYLRIAEWFESFGTYEQKRWLIYRFADEVAPGKTTCLEIVRKTLLPGFASGLPETFADWFQQADQEVNQELRYGLSFAVGEMVLQIVSLFPAGMLPETVVPFVSQARQRGGEIFERQLKRTIELQPMKSVIAGFGVSFSRDLESRLREVLKALGDGFEVRLLAVEGEVAGLAVPKDCIRVDRGWIAAFDTKETSERKTSRVLRWWREAEAPALNKEELLEQVIWVKTTEAVGHVRIRFDIRDGKKREVEINRFFRREFVQETSHPIQDVKVVRVEYARERAAKAPVLRVDRIWTANEMLDWSRRIALDLAVAEILPGLGGKAFSLAGEAEKYRLPEEIAARVDSWGKCSGLLQRFDVEKFAPVDGFEMDGKTKKEFAEIQALRKRAREQMFRALAVFLAK